jgi:hypothetical protein
MTSTYSSSMSLRRTHRREHSELRIVADSECTRFVIRKCAARSLASTDRTGRRVFGLIDIKRSK